MKNNLLLMMILLTPALAVADGKVNLQTTAQIEEIVLNEKGETESRLVPATTVVPGDEVIYTITFSNESDDEAEMLTITDPLPDAMRYVEGSAFSGGTDILFSVDGGSSFARPEELTVLDEDANPRTARAADYTHIRWALRNPLQPGKRGYARFRAQLR